MDFSEYTLISFGDSFTFGQDTVPKYDTSGKDIRPARKQYKIDCNNLSYTKILVDNLGFKNSINFGVLGGSNDRSLSLLEPFLRQNPMMKVFVLFNFTSSSRFMNFFKEVDNNEYSLVDILPCITHLHKNYEGLNSESINNYYTYWRNSVQEVYQHIKDRRMLYYMLSTHNTPHVSFDGINDMDYRMIRDNPLNYVLNENIEGSYNDDENYVFKEMDFMWSYYNDLVDKSPLLSHIEIEYYGGKRNICHYLLAEAAKPSFNNPDYFTGPSNHWNSEGHIEVAKLIEKYINENYN